MAPHIPAGILNGVWWPGSPKPPSRAVVRALFPEAMIDGGETYVLARQGCKDECSARVVNLYNHSADPGRPGSSVPLGKGSLAGGGRGLAGADVIIRCNRDP